MIFAALMFFVIAAIVAGLWSEIRGENSNRRAW